jgi:hypothetical protein
MFFEGIRSERQLMSMVNMRLDHRWFIGYDLTEAVPDHSSLSKIRTRYGLEVFQRFFERIVELWPRWYARARQHVDALFEEPITPEPTSNPRGLVGNSDGTHLTGRR